MKEVTVVLSVEMSNQAVLQRKKLYPIVYAMYYNYYTGYVWSHGIYPIMKCYFIISFKSLITIIRIDIYILIFTTESCTDRCLRNNIYLSFTNE